MNTKICYNTPNIIYLDATVILELLRANIVNITKTYLAGGPVE